MVRQRLFSHYELVQLVRRIEISTVLLESGISYAMQCEGGETNIGNEWRIELLRL